MMCKVSVPVTAAVADLEGAEPAPPPPPPLWATDRRRHGTPDK